MFYVGHPLTPVPMLKVTISRVRPGREDRLRAWLAELNTRLGEVRETFRNEGVRHEQAYLIEGADGLLLVYASEAEDHDHVMAAFAASTLPIDREHAAVMADVLAERMDVAPAYACALDT